MDRRQAGWAVFTLVAFGAAVWGYALARTTEGGAHGGSPAGLAFGALALATILFAAALGLRKSLVRSFGLGSLRFVPPLGHLEGWLKAHVWLGLLGLPLALFHCGFRAGGTLGTVLLALLAGVVVTGVLGAALQHFLPHLLTTREQGETTHEQAPRRLWNLVSDAQAVVKKACEEAYKTAKEARRLHQAGAAARAQELEACPAEERPRREAEQAERGRAYVRAIEEAVAALERIEATRERIDRVQPRSSREGLRPAPPPAGARRSRASMGTRLAPALAATPAKPAPDPATLVAPAELVAFWTDVALPFLLDPRSARSPLADDLGAEVIFESVKGRLPEASRPALAELRARCDAARRKARQASLHALLHGWLLVHVPLAMALVVLAVVHAVMALRY